MLWDVHLLTAKAEPGFTVVVEEETEHGALAKALRFFPWAWVWYTSPHNERKMEE